MKTSEFRKLIREEIRKVLTEKFRVGDVVANKKHKTIGIVRLPPERGELKTDADGNVDIRDLELYDPKKHKSYQIAPSTKKELGW